MYKQASVREILMRLMKRADISESELARRTSVPQPTINRILQGGSRDPRTGTLEKLAGFFNITVAQLRGEATLSQLEQKEGEEQDPLAALLSPMQQRLLQLFEMLTDDQQDECLHSLEATKQRNQQVYEKLSRKHKKTEG